MTTLDIVFGVCYLLATYFVCDFAIVFLYKCGVSQLGRYGFLHMIAVTVIVLVAAILQFPIYDFVKGL
jgi:hypothetical protein